MFIGCYTLDGKQYNAIYYGNIKGHKIWIEDTFSPYAKDIETLDFTIKGKTYKEKKENARQLAIDWQNNFTCLSWSYSELAEITSYFEKIGKRYGLAKEFKENAIC